MDNYVKFMRGTPTQYANLASKDSDTLYFISEPEATVGALYLGTKLIAGGSNQANALSLKELLDVALADVIGDGNILVYDAQSSKWVNSTIELIIGAFSGATADKPGMMGLVPAPAAGQTNAFLKSDGTWAEISSNQQITSVENTAKVSHDTIMADRTKVPAPKHGDILIIKDIIINDKYSYTAYVYNGTAWEAMDGNYDANNVYFKEDFIFTEDIGTVVLTEEDNGSKEVEAAGKNVKEFLASLFAKEKAPIVTAPTATLNLKSASSGEVGSTYTPQYEVTFSAGSYEYGPATGITATYAISDSNSETATTAAGYLPEFTLTDTTSYTISAVVSHTEGRNPLNNLGNESPDDKIAAATLPTLTTKAVVGYRNAFYGSVDNKNEITAAVIRGLTPSNAKVSNGSTGVVNLSTNTVRVIIAYPATLRDLTSVTDTNAWGTDVVGNFQSTTIDVPGYNNYEAISYKVFYADFAEGSISKANTYKFKI